ncbi:MAG: hypothetical protein LBK65_02405 [Tannerellaceae bacterium]|jgi:hypothetical protein|nr:hypothetical protein [Tannerellaceae bacterium]
MKTMEKVFDEQESLKLITDMISQARERFQQRNGNGIILWGYSIMALALANFVLLQTLAGECKTYAYMVWLCSIPLFAAHYIYEVRTAKAKEHAGNYIDKMIGYVWAASFVTNLILVASVFILACVVLREYQGWTMFLVINPAIMSAVGLCLFINGQLCRFRPFVYGAVVFWAGALASALVMMVCGDQSMQFIILALCMILGFIIPGHMLNRKTGQDV